MVRHAELKRSRRTVFLEDQRSARLWRSTSRTWSSTRFRKRTKETPDKDEDVFDESGKKMRKRTIERRRGRPEEFTIKTRAAYEEKLAHPESLGR